MYEGLKDKVIILTGAGGLIGRESLKHLVKNGAKVIAVDVNSFESKAELFLTNDMNSKSI
jgi:NAD(P)-dependent dehydrogenase (short-subunit alcohol dehydrogenase family)